MSDELRVALWDAINRVVSASGGDPSNTSVARQKAVVEVERIVASLALVSAADVVRPEERAALEAWTHQHGKALVPHGGWADTFGDGMRCAKQQVAALLARRAAKEAKGG